MSAEMLYISIGALVVYLGLLAAIPWAIHVHDWDRLSDRDYQGKALYRCTSCGENGVGWVA